MYVVDLPSDLRSCCAYSGAYQSMCIFPHSNSYVVSGWKWQSHGSWRRGNQWGSSRNRDWSTSSSVWGNQYYDDDGQSRAPSSRAPSHDSAAQGSSSDWRPTLTPSQRPVGEKSSEKKLALTPSKARLGEEARAKAKAEGSGGREPPETLTSAQPVENVSVSLAQAS